MPQSIFDNRHEATLGGCLLQGALVVDAVAEAEPTQCAAVALPVQVEPLAAGLSAAVADVLLHFPVLPAASPWPFSLNGSASDVGDLESTAPILLACSQSSEVGVI